MTLASGPLTTLSVLFVDAQTTGAGPSSGRLLELAWQVYPVATAAETPRPVAHLLRGPDEEIVPPRILKLTGLTQAEIKAGVSEMELVEHLADALATVTHVVAHFSRFEAAFLEDLWQRVKGEAFPRPWLCTHVIGRRLWPGLPSGSLRAMAGAAGHGVDALKRAGPHVEATSVVWCKILQELKTRESIETLDQLAAWLKIKPVKADVARQYMVDRQFRLQLPDVPGIYKMIGPGGRILYVGKATSLKSRVNSYFRQRRGHAASKRELLSQVVDIVVVPCPTALEAALLEVDEIKRHDPPYNVALREYTRRVAFLERALITKTETAIAALGCYGPYPTEEPLLGLRLIVMAESAGLPELLTALFYRDVAQETVLEGLALFVAEVAAYMRAPLSIRSLLAVGVRAVRRALKEEDPPEEEEDDETEASDSIEAPPLTPDEVRLHLWAAVHAAGREHLRARSLRRLADATVAWRDKGAKQWRFLRIAGGQIIEGGYTTRPKSLASPKEVASCTWDIATYDRLRVLTTELARAEKAGTKVRLTTALDS